MCLYTVVKYYSHKTHVVNMVFDELQVVFTEHKMICTKTTSGSYHNFMRHQ